MFSAVTCVFDGKASLAECPRWSVAEQCLYWVDINARRLHRFDPADGSDYFRTFEQPVASFALRAKGGFVLAMRDGFALLDGFDGELRLIEPQIESHLAENRFNDGRCDRRGRFWAGTMDGTKKLSNGALYRLDPDLGIHRLADGALTANGLAFSPDHSKLYWADTPRHIIYQYEFNESLGLLGARRVFATFAFGKGRPDGAAVDSQGNYWSALWAGARVVCLAPDGSLLQEVVIPAVNCSMIAFGGPDLKTAYVTTARDGMSAEDLGCWPQAGGIFAFRSEVGGLPDPMFAG